MGEHMLTNDLLAGADAAASFIGVSRNAVYHLVRSGRLPTIRKGKRLYFRKSELEQAFRSDPVD